MIYVGDTVVPFGRPVEERRLGWMQNKKGVVVGVDGLFINVKFEEEDKIYTFFVYELKKIECCFRNPSYEKIKHRNEKN